MRLKKEKLRNQSHLQLPPKPIKHLRINLTKEVKDLYPKNYRTLMKEIEEVTKMEKHSMLMDWKNKYCENVYATQGNLHVQ